MWKLEELACHCGLKSVNAGDTVTDRNHTSGFADFNAFVVVLDLVFDDRADLFNINCHLNASMRWN